jgi:phospholipid transport system substrate-binding protein
MRRLAAALSLVVGFMPALAWAAATPRGTMEDFYGVLLGVMREAKALGTEGRARKLEPAIRATYDLPFMTRTAVGPTWTTITEEQRQQLVDAFSRYTVAVYASRFNDYSGETFQVTGERPSTSNGVIVETRVVPTGSPPVSLNYLLRDSDGDWKVVDVFLTGTISELATRRSEFATTLRQGGPDALIALLDRKTAELGAS